MSALHQFDRAKRDAWQRGESRVAKGELHLVPLEMIPRAWRHAKFAIQAPKTGIGRAYDIERLHGRLLLGIDRLWIAALTAGCDADKVAGVVVTSIGGMPKDAPYLFNRKDKNSLTAHFIAGRSTQAWIADAVEKVARYGEENGCKQLFALARMPWIRYLYSFYGRFERVGLARDRVTKRGRKMRNALERPGRFRLLCKDLPPRMGYECARHQSNRVYIPPKGERHGRDRQSHDYSAAAAAPADYAV